MKKIPIRIGIIIGNKKYLPLCLEGLKYLAEEQTKSKISVPWGIETADRWGILKMLISRYTVDVWIIVSGTYELSMIASSFLRNVLHSKVSVIGVAFENMDSNPDFLDSCRQAVNKSSPKMEFKPAPPPDRTSLDEAIKAAEKITLQSQ